LPATIVKPPLSPDIMRDRRNLLAPDTSSHSNTPSFYRRSLTRGFNSRWSFDCTTVITGPITAVNLKRGARTSVSDGNVSAA
jgi:hypothetical protein